MPQETTKSREIGFVKSSQDYLLYLEGLPSVRINDVIVSSKGGRAIVTGLDRERIEALMLDSERPGPGEMFKLYSNGLEFSLGHHLLGRTVNSLGEAKDNKSLLAENKTRINLDEVAPGINSRKIINEQYYTGICLVDTLLPIGKGQRELLFGPPRSGKSSFLLDLIINQKGKNTICVYTALGRSDIDVTRFVTSIHEAGGASYTSVICASSTDAAPLIAIAPAVAFSVAEHFVLQGWDVLLILDDLGTHAKYLREIALLSSRIPGRESYPADIFYAHSHLVERAGNFNEQHGNAAITLLPVIETDLENFTSLIPTNLMSMTDGHMLFSVNLRAQGQYPAIEVDRSVTRVGHQTQKPIHKILADKIRSLLADYHELERYGRFGSELTGETQQLIKQGMMTTELLKQEPLQPIDPPVQILLLALVFTPFFNNRDVEFLRKYKNKIIQTLTQAPKFKEITKECLNNDLNWLIVNMKKNLNILEEEACLSSET